MSHGQRYQVIELIAAGGMAEVYRGESAGIEGFRKKVAIKRVLPKLSANRDFINMFLDEARLCAYLSHSKCVQVFDIGQGAGAHFIVMEYVDGADLKGILDHLSTRKERLPIEVACRVCIDICEGLAYAHQASDHNGHPLNIVHRDISPHNVLITRYGEVKLVDFGLAKASSHLSEDDEDMVKGKFGYLAPEVTLGKPSDKRVDIFAAGILLWEMLASRRLFQGETDLDTFKLVRAAQVPDVREFCPEASADLVAVLSRALARDPVRRYPTADDFARELNLVVLQRGLPVTYQEVAKYVRNTATERDRKKRSATGARAGVIGDLIIDTIHDFSGGESGVLLGEGATLGTETVQPLSSDFVDPTQWGLDALFADAPGPAPKALPDLEAKGRPNLRTETHLPAEAPRNPPATAVTVAPLEEAPAKPVKPDAAVERPGEKKDGPFWRRWFGS